MKRSNPPVFLAADMDASWRAGTAADALEIIGMALSLQGKAALTANNREQAARHEAGHAVQFKAEGERVRSVAVFRRDAGWLGYTDAGSPWAVNPETDPAADLARARILIAGSLSEVLTAVGSSFAAGADEVAMARTIVGHAAYKLRRDPQALMMETVGRTVETLGRYRTTIDWIASALLRQRKIARFELARLLREVRPGPSSGESGQRQGLDSVQPEAAGEPTGT